MVFFIFVLGFFFFEKKWLGDRDVLVCHNAHYQLIPPWTSVCWGLRPLMCHWRESPPALPENENHNENGLSKLNRFCVFQQKAAIMKMGKKMPLLLPPSCTRRNAHVRLHPTSPDVLRLSSVSPFSPRSFIFFRPPPPA